MIQKSYIENGFGKLYLVPTPIGNLEDMTYRAVETLKTVDLVYAEDTRVTSLLLKQYNIKKPIYSCHKYSEEKNKEKILSELKEGKNIAYASDRGTPLISDPGSVIVKFVIESGIQVIALPGPSALLPAINMSGLDNDRFIFYGFLNSKKTIKIQELKELSHLSYTIIFYEAPHRINDTLNCMKVVFGNRNISICREISKIHEEVFRGKIDEAIIEYSNPRGEFVIIVDGNSSVEKYNYVDLVKELVDKGYKMSNAIKEVSTIYGISKNALYNECKERFL